MTASDFSVVSEDPAELSYDSRTRVQVPVETPVTSIATLAEVAPFVIVTNERLAPVFCLSAILAVVGRVIYEETLSTENVAWLPFITT